MSLSRVCRLVNAPLVMVVWMLWGHGIAVSAERPIAGARIAVAANFRDTAEAIALHLEAHSDYHYDIIVGSTGKLASQVINGAPFDVLMAADRARPQRLVEEGYAVAGAQRTYAPQCAQPAGNLSGEPCTCALWQCGSNSAERGGFFREIFSRVGAG